TPSHTLKLHSSYICFPHATWSPTTFARCWSYTATWPTRSSWRAARRRSDLSMSLRLALTLE
ncbi:unnamed protein product, partial [Symbiodinium pilosum]